MVPAATSFQEDCAHILRAIRIAARLEFSISSETAHSVKHLSYSVLRLDKVDLYLLPQAAFPTGGLYFKNKTWVKETEGKHVIIHNNCIVSFGKKIKRFCDYGL